MARRAAARRDGGMEGRHLKHAEIERDLRVIQGDVFRQLGHFDKDIEIIAVVNQMLEPIIAMIDLA